MWYQMTAFKQCGDISIYVKYIISYTTHILFVCPSSPTLYYYQVPTIKYIVDPVDVI